MCRRAMNESDILSRPFEKNMDNFKYLGTNINDKNNMQY